VTETRERLPEYRALLERTRGERLEGEIKVSSLTEGQLRARLGSVADADAARARAIARSWVRLGLLPEPTGGARDERVSETVTHGLALYDPGTKTFSILHPEVARELLEPAIVHELDHALEDARFDFGKLARGTDDVDSELALRFLIEGEASYVATVARLAGKGVPREAADMLVAARGELSREQRIERIESAAAALGEGTDALLAAGRDARRAPLFSYDRLVLPYTRGAALVARVRRAGGWEAVDRLYRQPPRSTHECLHEDELLAGKKPGRVTLGPLAAKLEGWELLHEDTLGELALGALIETRLGRTEPAASAWDGDRIQVFARESRTALVWKLAFTGEGEAEAILRAAAALAAIDAPSLAPGELSRARRQGRTVILILGAPEGALEALFDAASR
jgi:hypothetical protein